MADHLPISDFLQESGMKHILYCVCGLIAVGLIQRKSSASAVLASLAGIGDIRSKNGCMMQPFR